jgi:choline/carnitine/betaine transport
MNANQTANTNEPKQDIHTLTPAAAMYHPDRDTVKQPADQPKPDKSKSKDRSDKPLNPAIRVLRHVSDPVLTIPETGATIHPALIPGIGVEDSGNHRFHTNWPVFAVALVFVIGLVGWGIISPDSLSNAANSALNWISVDFGWLFQILTVAVFVFMIWIGFGRHRNIKLGRDDEKPEFSTVSWVTMLFSAGIGIGLLFFGPAEPMAYFTDQPPIFQDAIDPETHEAMIAALVQTLFHWGPVAWAYYALVGGAVAYVAFRKGRVPLMSSILEPIFGEKKTKGPLGAIIDAVSILVTLFGTAMSLGIGALQISEGFQVLTGASKFTNAMLVGLIALLTCAFIASAVSGLKRGIRALSNINMGIAALLALLVFIVGPSLLLLNLIPSVASDFAGDLFALFAQSGASTPDAQAFMNSWTTYYWAWWIAWTPFVGLFIAKISRGRTLKQFVLATIIVPSLVCLIWFTIIGGTTMWQQMQGLGLSESESSEAMLFNMFNNLPIGGILSVLAMISIFIFFVTTADSASVVMASMSQRGNPQPSRWNIVVWGLSLGAIAAVLLVGGGSVALNGLRSLVIVAALPFTIVIILIMVAWARELGKDPVSLRRRYAQEAIIKGVREGIETHGDDFMIGTVPTQPNEGAGAWLDTDDSTLTDWYVPKDLLEDVDSPELPPDK